jgi:hypothetical protein
VWKIAAHGFLAGRTVHKPMGIPGKSLMALAFLDRTRIGAIRVRPARYRYFSFVSAGFLTGFSAASSEN